MNDMSDVLERLSAAHVLVVGDVMLDRYVIGSVSRISPEAPVPVVSVEREDEMIGGAGNVARNVVSLGARCTLVGVIGGDADGAALVQQVDAAGIAGRLLRDDSRRTTVKTRILAKSQQVVRLDREVVRDLTPEVETALCGLLDAAAADAGVIVLSDYGKGVITDRVCRHVFALARRHGIPTVTDPKDRDFARYRGTTIIKPNRREVLLATGLYCDDDATTVAAGQRVVTITDADAVLISRSEQGLSVVHRDGSSAHFHAEAREVFDVSGAGDTVVAVAAAAIASGSGVMSAAEAANLAAGIVVGRLGTAAVTRAELYSAFSRTDDGAYADKIVDNEAAAARVRLWKSRGLTVGFTNGCFDLLHAGHVSILRAARAACDRLVVALNDDASVKRLKGADRPINDQGSRAALLAAIEAVDLVTIFSADTPLELIETLRPDVLVKGGDYTPDEVVGKAVVERHGGRVLIAPLVGGHSTTAMIGRIGETTPPRPADRSGS